MMMDVFAKDEMELCLKGFKDRWVVLFQFIDKATDYYPIVDLYFVDYRGWVGQLFDNNVAVCRHK